MKPILFSSLLLIVVAICAGCSGSDEAVETNIHAHTALYAGALSDDGRFALAASVNHGAGFWDLASNRLLFNWRHSENKPVDILQVAISPDNRFAITADIRSFVVWETVSGKSLGYWEMPNDIMTVDVSRNGQFVVLGLSDGTVHHVNLLSGRRLEFMGHTEKVNAVNISPYGRYVISGGNDHQAIVWDALTAQPLYHFKHNHRVTLVLFSDDGKFAFSAAAQGAARVWDLQTGQLVNELDVGEKPFTIVSARFSSDNKQLITGGAARIIQLWDMHSGKSVKRWHVRNRDIWRPSGAIVYDVAFSQDQQYVLTESSNGLSQRWKL